uniref:MARVEL domain-containing protein n=1 Tax=Steinernema glaseri TaxID=37863 RepID=A0A1I7ZNS0_9BILA
MISPPPAPSPSPKCCHYIPLVVLSAFLAIAYALLSIGTSYLALTEAYYALASVLFLVHSIFTIMYFCGLKDRNEWIMIPALVVEILLRIVAGFIVMALWFAYVLFLFDIIQFESPLDSASPSQFLLCVSLLSTLLYALLIRLLFPFYDGYRHTKKLNDYDRMHNSITMQTSYTSRPTSV